MQTFLPYSSFKESALALDYRRLGKQRVETFQILDSLLNSKKGWSNHPATLQWKDHEWSLARYGLAMCHEWRKRGYNPGVTIGRITELKQQMSESSDFTDQPEPAWLGDEAYHQSHRLKLLWKDPEFYSNKFPSIQIPTTEPEYVWPVTKGVLV